VALPKESHLTHQGGVMPRQALPRAGDRPGASARETFRRDVAEGATAHSSPAAREIVYKFLDRAVTPTRVK
jgi:hypothetical protein